LMRSSDPPWWVCSSRHKSSVDDPHGAVLVDNPLLVSHKLKLMLLEAVLGERLGRWAQTIRVPTAVVVLHLK
jgi:hypothetical protein